MAVRQLEPSGRDEYAGGTFAGKNYVLMGESEIVLKTGEKVITTDKIDGTKLGKTDIDYKDVDYICLIKTSLRGGGFEKANGSKYKYIDIKNKPQLVQIIYESPKISFYQERPKMTGGGYDAVGNFQQHGQTAKTFMLNNADGSVKEIDLGKNGKNIPKIFSDCPRLIQYQKDKNMRSLLSLVGIVYIYNNNCTEASPEDMQDDSEAIEKIRTGIYKERYPKLYEKVKSN